MAGESGFDYDPSSRESIVSYAQKLVGSTLREHLVVDDAAASGDSDAEGQDADGSRGSGIARNLRHKGSFGNAIEKLYFGYAPNSSSAPDFEQAGLELKTTPLKYDGKGNLVAKERLTIGMINYREVVDETFATSHFMQKASRILLVSYLWEKGKDPLDCQIRIVSEWSIPEEDLPVFEADWQTVVDKVRAGLAHEISSSDTMYLEAATKGANSADTREQPFSDIPAKSRAWAIKASYMTAVSAKLLTRMEPILRRNGEEKLGLAELVRARFEPYFGRTEESLAREFGYLGDGKRRKPKNLCALVTGRILGVDEDSKIAEFEKAGVRPKTIRVQCSGRPKEAMSFPAFDYGRLAEEPFEESDFFEDLQCKYLFVVYRESAEERGTYRMAEVAFWQMPEADLEAARECYDEMARRVREGRAADSVRSTENRCCHVRPHGRDSRDTVTTPFGETVVKKSFWLNQNYLAGEIARVTGR